ncbi:hypothetical protein BT63DRAFT_216295 [Microthyrium microscopicum]|uniref:NTF2-domain-containing protein n=1 Tax=Microthyrium microscopicum TaxID=703497 RepID=A0A6A6UIN9_9PEZI|nr:hypothetical protein BT63DRAFT_216295 [Microthyrium microscopicum]
MATELSGPTNGYSVPTSTSPGPAQTPSTQTADFKKEEIGWYFVERYYNTLSKNPDNLYLLYNKKSQFVAGKEEEKVKVSIGLKAINERVKELNYQNCKVRITNVDSQASADNIVVQVIGEMTDDLQPHRKFAQTFVLAPQPQGYYLLNDILRFLNEDEEEPIEAQAEETKPVEEEAAPLPVETKSEEKAISTEETIAKVDEQLEETAKAEEVKPVNGTSHVAQAVDEPVEEAASVPVEDETPTKAEEAAAAPSPAAEKPAEPTPTPAEPKAAPKAAPVPTKPATPMSWAQRLSANSARQAAASASAAPAAASAAPAASTPAPKPAPQSSSTQATAPTTAPAQTAAPAREPSPVDSNQEGSTGGWQMAGADHSRTKSRSAQAGPQTTDNGHVRAYVKNVYQTVGAEDLKAALSKYGELAYFDISRQKNSAFVEFKNVDGFKAAVAANPHKIGTDNVIVEERRITPQFSGRGNTRGGRGGFEGRTNPGGRGGFANKEGGAPRGNFTGNRGGRGGPAVPNRGGRPQQAV